MKRFLATSLIALALVVGGVGARAFVAHAQAGAGTAANENAAAGEAQAAGDTSATQTIKGDQVTPNNQPPQTDQSTFGWVLTTIMGLFAWLLGVAAIVLDNAVFYTVVTMGEYVSHLNAVGVAWHVLRDIGNIVLIFGFLAIGISVILDIDAYGYSTKMLPTLLIVAVMLNFSLFITEAIIDVGNLFATQFYTQINGGQPASAPSFGLSDFTGGGAVHAEGISNKIMSQLGLQSLYGDSQVNSDIFKGGHTIFIGFMGIILFLIAAFVFFSLAFILIARFVALVFLIVVAPIGFAGLAVPKLEKLASQWWSTLINQTLTAPVLLLMLYVALQVITDAKFLTGFGGTQGDTWTGWITGADNGVAGLASLMLSFMVAMGLLLAVTVLAKKMSAFGASAATKWAGAATFGATSLGGRLALGGTGNLLASKRAQAWAANGRFKYLKRVPVFAGKGLRSLNYDFRNAPGVGSALGTLGVDAGKGATLTPRQMAEAEYGLKPVKKYFKESEAEYQQAALERRFTDAQRRAQVIQDAYEQGAITRVQRDAQIAPEETIIGGALSKMSTKQLEELDGIKKGTETLVKNLSPQQFEALMKSDKLLEVDKGHIKDARYRALASAVGSGSTPEIKKALNAYSKGELEAMPSELLANHLVLGQLSDKQRENITESKERTAAEKDLVRSTSKGGSVETAFKAAGGGAAGAAAVAGLIGGLTTTQAAKLDKEILREPMVAERLTSAMLIELQEQKKLTGNEMTGIGAAIRASGVASPAVKAYVTTGPGAALWS